MIRNSAVYDYLSGDFRDKALNAKGDDMARYAALFADARTLMGKADADLRAADIAAVKEYKLREKDLEKEMNVSVEKTVRREEEKRQETLLEELDKT